MDYDPTKPGPIKQPTTFEEELETLINRYSLENVSDTPDFVLAQFVMGCLDVWNAAVQRREEWYGRDERGSDGGTGASPHSDSGAESGATEGSEREDPQ